MKQYSAKYISKVEHPEDVVLPISHVHYFQTVLRLWISHFPDLEAFNSSKKLLLSTHEDSMGQLAARLVM